VQWQAGLNVNIRDTIRYHVTRVSHNTHNFGVVSRTESRDSLPGLLITMLGRHQLAVVIVAGFLVCGVTATGVPSNGRVEDQVEDHVQVMVPVEERERGATCDCTPSGCPTPTPSGCTAARSVLWLPLGDSITWGCNGPTIQDCHSDTGG
jgi:hypothetical protein